jgi:NitT/TauT family transport system permease protein
MRLAQILPMAGLVAALAAVAGAFGSNLHLESPAGHLLLAALMLALAIRAGMRLALRRQSFPLVIDACITVASGVTVVGMLDQGLEGKADWGFWAACMAVWLAAWQLVEALVGRTARGWRRAVQNLAVPVLFGATVLFLWETVVRGAGVPRVILPAPTAIASRFAGSIPILAADFAQTFHGVAAGYIIGCGAGLASAILIDRIAFLKRGLLPLGNLVSALPIVGIAPIMVMWFGFDWPSKAAVVVILTFFPMLVNTVAGLAAAGAMERDLMKTYAANYAQTLTKLRMPAALPFVFNGLKVNSTLALIGAIVAEFFGTPIVGMGFRINTEVGRMNIDMVWATIVVAALSGSLFYGLLALIERQVTFWHASYRQRAA